MLCFKDYWREDNITLKYVAENANMLSEPANMTPDDLTEAITYCTTYDNPFSVELIKRAGLLDNGLNTELFDKKFHINSKIVKKAARAFNIQII